MRKTKIVCTLGPATDNDGVLEELVKNGMNVARMNFSHSTYEEHEKRMKQVHKLAEKYDRPIAVLLDTKGPEIRTGELKEEKVLLQKGSTLILTAEPVQGDASKVSITFPTLYQDVSAGTEILLDDGLIALEVIEVTKTDIVCRVKNDGWLSAHKGINVPNVHINMPYMNEKDKNDILFGIRHQVDFIAASFVRTSDDVKELRKFLDDNGGSAIHIISKIENIEGVKNIDSIIAASEGIMVARGDMGVELPPEEVPAIQKMIIRKVYEAGKQVVTATQMLDSMMKNPRPTRAEVADVANAVYDGTSAIMLSGETAAGKYPVEALQMMVRIAQRTEEDIDYRHRFEHFTSRKSNDITAAISHATCTTAYDISAKAIVTVTKSGRSARMISKYRPDCTIIAGTTDETVYRQLGMSWGVIPVLVEEKQDIFELFSHAIDVARQKELVEKGDLVVLTSGVPLGVSGTTNMLKVQMV
ncbi:MAG: pyruvate kinase [Butyribacter sp.]|nr:pyruvate kinase [bacterium]MDY3855376.1 pyruvate kinase [Butyribacter sp.]